MKRTTLSDTLVVSIGAVADNWFHFQCDTLCYLEIFGSRLKGQDYRSVDIGLAVSQLCLMAEERGLGSCILGWFDEAKLQNLLHTQRRIRLVVALGHAAEGYPIRKKQRKPLSELVEFR